jgi:hypothetical protein
MTGNQSPELLVLDQGDRQGNSDSHVTKVFQVDKTLGENQSIASWVKQQTFKLQPCKLHRLGCRKLSST